MSAEGLLYFVEVGQCAAAPGRTALRGFVHALGPRSARREELNLLVVALSSELGLNGAKPGWWRCGTAGVTRGTSGTN